MVTKRIWCLLTGFLPISAAASIYLLKPSYAIGSVPSLSGYATAYRWRSLPRVRRHRASKPQGSSERVLPWQVTMNQVICASLSHTHNWYEVGMLKVPACDSQRLKPTGIQISTKSLPGLTTREIGNLLASRRCLWVLTIALLLSTVLPSISKMNC